MSSYKRTVLIVTVSQLINFGLPIITFPLLVKALDISQYGIWITVSTVIGLAIAFSSVGLNNAVGTLLVSQPEKDKLVYSNGLYLFIVLCGGIGLMVAASAPVINQIVTHQPIGVRVIQLSAITILTGSLNQLGLQIFRVRHQPLRGAIFDILLAMSRLAAAVMLAFRHDLLEFAAIYALLQTIITSIQIWVAYYGIPLQRPSLSIVKQLIKYGVNLAIVSQASWLVMFGDRLMLSIFSTTESVAIYSASYQITLVLVALGAPYSYSVLPLLGERWTNKDIAGIQAIIRRSTRATSILLVPAIVGLVFTGTSLLKVLATDQFAQSGLLVGMIGLGVGLDVLGVNLQYLFFAQGRPDILRQVYLRAVIFNFAANLIAIPLFSYYGAALTTLLTFMLTTYLMWKRTEMPLSALFDLDAFKRCILASTAMGVWVIATVGSDIPHLLMSVLGGAIIYGLGIVSLKVISIAQIRYTLLTLLKRGAT